MSGDDQSRPVNGLLSRTAPLMGGCPATEQTDGAEKERKTCFREERWKDSGRDGETRLMEMMFT